MSRIVIAAFVFAAAFVIHARAAEAMEGPWCAVLNFGSDVTEDCQYRTFEECAPHVIAGFRGFCNHNPRWQGAAVEPRWHGKRAVRRQ